MKTYFIDTNILIYAQGEEHPHKSPSQAVLRLIATDEICGITSTEVLQEILYRYAAIGKKQLGFRMVENALAVLHEIVAVERPDIVLAINIMRRHNHINVRDAIHAATALREGVKYIISVDKHFDNIHGLQRVDPANL